MLKKIKVFPNSSENKIQEHGSLLYVYVKAKPEKGKANLAVLKLLKKKFPHKEIKLKGLTSRNKIAEVI